MSRSVLAASLSVVLFCPVMVLAQDANVTVVAILASDRHKNVDPKLTAVAEEVKKDHPNLTGLRIERTSKESVTLNQKKSFPLVKDVDAEITFLAREDKDKKVKVSVKSPHTGEIIYTIVPN